MSWEELCFDIEDIFCSSFVWKIENFTVGMPFRSKPLCSPAFTLPLIDVSWRIMIQRYLGSGDYLAIYVRQISDERPEKELGSKVTLSIVSIDGSKVKYIKSQNFPRYWGSGKFMSWNSLLAEKATLLPHNTLTVKCEIFIDFPTCNIELLRDLKLIYNKEKSDMTLFPGTEDDSFCSECLTEPNNSFEITDSPQFRTHSPPILHKWFHHVYKGEDKADIIQSLDADLQNTVLTGMGRYPNGVPTKSLLHSVLKSQNVFFTWYIRDFSSLILNKKLFSPAFRCESSEWKLMFYLTKDYRGREIAEIHVCPMSLHSISKKLIMCRVSIVTKDGRLPISREALHLYNDDGPWRFPPFILTAYLKKEKALYLANDVLCLYCTFLISDGRYEHNGDVTWTQLQFSQAGAEILGIRRLSLDMLHLLESGQFSDVLLKVGDTEIPAHKSILSQRSNKFRLVVSEDVSVVEMHNLEVETLKKILKFIYAAWTDFDKDEMDAVFEYGSSVESKKHDDERAQVRLSTIAEGVDDVRFKKALFLT